MSLRNRLTIALVALVAVGLVVSDVVTYRALKSFLYDRLDQQVAAYVQPLSVSLTGSQRGAPGGFRGPVPTPETAPVGTWAAHIEPDGTVSKRLSAGYNPDTGPRPVWDAGDLDGHFHTVNGTGGGGRFRLLALGEGNGDIVLVAMPLHDVEQTLGKLVGIELLATLMILAAMGIMARFLVRRGLRPLEDIGLTAGAIAAGDLSRRVELADEQTEVGQLGLALNSMLGQIETAFAAQQASENRLRRFVADASHELRTPLTSIRGYAELFRRGAADRPEDLAKAMRRIEQEAGRMGVLVDDLLLLARLDQGRPLVREPVDLARLAADAVDDAQAVDPEREIFLEATAPTTVSGDDLRLRQVVANLLSNARQHTPAGTPVRVTVGSDNGSATLEVADEGPGMTAEQASHVFERFYRGDDARTRAHGGTGLGLAIVAAITEAHGGKAAVETALGHGARFRIRLPLISDAGVRGDSGYRPSSPSPPPERPEIPAAE